MNQIDYFFQKERIKHAGFYSVLDTAVQIDGEHTFRTGRNSSGSQRITETVVLYLITQAAATAQRIGLVAHISKEGMPLCIHLGSEVTVFFIQHVTVFCQECHCLDRECQYGAGAFFIKPFHKTLLQPAE